MAEQPTPVLDGAIRLADDAFQAALAGRRDAASNAVQRIGDTFGVDGICVALAAWCDTLADHATDGRVKRRSRMRFLDRGTGRLHDADSDAVPPGVAWTARLVAARAAQDWEGFKSIVAEPTGSDVGRYVWTALRHVASTINTLPRGYALMGGGS